MIDEKRDIILHRLEIIGNIHYIYECELDDCPVQLDMKKYTDQLCHPYWKIKRQEILFRDNNECQLCFYQQYLQVHHKMYFKNHLAWEYPNHYLITLCSKCHELFEENKHENDRDTPVINPERAKHQKLYKRIYEIDFNERERKIINYIVLNSRQKKQTIKLDAERLQTNKRSVLIGLENLLKSKLIFETDKPNIYKYNPVYFGY